MRTCLLTLAITVLAGPAWAQGCLPYEPAQVTLTGKLSTGRGYGPPGFGEDPQHDRKESFAQVTLDKAACVSGGTDTNEDVAAIRTFQLVPGDGARYARKLLGRRVAVTGKLYHRVSGGHTEVMILYTAVASARPDSR